MLSTRLVLDNPTYIFNGNRLTMISQYEIEDKKGKEIETYKLAREISQKHEAEQFDLPIDEKTPFEEKG